MNKKVPLFFGISLLFSFLLLSVLPVFGQPQDKSVTRLKLENNRLRTIAEDKNTTPEIRELNQQLLIKNENLLREAILKGISALEDYQTKNADLLDESDRTDINEKIEAHKYDLAQLGVKEIQKPTTEKVSNETVAVKTETAEIPKVVPVGFASKKENSSKSSEKKSEITSLTSNKTNSVNKKSTQDDVDDSIQIVSPPNAPVKRKRIQLKLKVKKEIKKVIIFQNGEETTLTIAKGIKPDAKGFRTQIIAIDLFKNDDQNKNVIEIVDADDNSKSSGEITVICENCGELSPTEVNAEEQRNVLDWGRVRGYFTSGVVFSKDRDITSTERNSFSKPDIYLDFTLDKNYVSREKRFVGIFNDVNTFFMARLTSVGVAAKTDSSTEAAATDETCNTADCTTFLTSEKVAQMQVGVYAPIYLTQWNRIAASTSSERNKWGSALFIAPIAKGGVQSIVGDRKNSTAEAQRFGGDDIYNFYSFGVLIGHLNLFKNKRDKAPDMSSYLSLTTGRWENHEYLKPTGTNDSSGNPFSTRVRPWRYEAIGRLKVPGTGFVIGFDGNFGKGPDDLRFIFGYKFDIGTMLNTLKIGKAEEADKEKKNNGEAKKEKKNNGEPEPE